MDFAVDKMHFKGHTDQWCKNHCNPNDFEDLLGVCITNQLNQQLLHYVHSVFLFCRSTQKYVSKLFHGYQDMHT